QDVIADEEGAAGERNVGIGSDESAVGQDGGVGLDNDGAIAAEVGANIFVIERPGGISFGSDDAVVDEAAIGFGEIAGEVGRLARAAEEDGIDAGNLSVIGEVLEPGQAGGPGDVAGGELAFAGEGGGAGGVGGDGEPLGVQQQAAED